MTAKQNWMVRRYTSTPAKWWMHKPQMTAYRDGTGHSVISTHVSPEGSCNLRCPYCSTTYKESQGRIKLDVIKDYIKKLKRRGLRAVILTGGGEPTLYPQFNELVAWLHEHALQIALITNGAESYKVDPLLWKRFTWIRVSVNFFPGWKEKIYIPWHSLDHVTIGMSCVFTDQHESPREMKAGWEKLLGDVADVANRINARYIRVMPDCRLSQDQFAGRRKRLASVLESVGDRRFFQQQKKHRAPGCSTCHQAYFRPYLSDEPYHETGEPGSVYPCDSVMLQPAREIVGEKVHQEFVRAYQICAPGDVLRFLDGEIKMAFDPQKTCTSCVFTDNVEMLGDWLGSGKGKFAESNGAPGNHDSFV